MKKLVLSTLIASLSLSTSAFAGKVPFLPGFYYDSDGSVTHMKPSQNRDTASSAASAGSSNPNEPIYFLPGFYYDKDGSITAMKYSGNKDMADAAGSSKANQAVYFLPGFYYDQDGSITSSKYSESKDLVDTAVSAGSFNTLVTAVKAAGLVDTLKGSGPYTVFAPTDEAFSKIPQDQLNALIADKEALTKVLTYHVVPGKVMSKDVVNLASAETVMGQKLMIDTTSGVKIDNAKVLKTDIQTSNGVIHVIDSVMLPRL